MAFEIKTGTFAELAEFVVPIRFQVFVHEQNVPAEIECDNRDGICQHVLIVDGERPIATGRIDFQSGNKLGRIAVLPEYRGQGIGKRVVQELERIARQQGVSDVWLHGQTNVVGFYERLGYQSVGPKFEEAGIPHRKMTKTLTTKQKKPGS